MSVLALRNSESISLPGVGVYMQVQGAVGNRVRIALQFPEYIDLPDEAGPAHLASISDTRLSTRLLSRQEFHDLKNDLHAIRLTLHVFHRQEQSGRISDAAATFERLARQVKSLSHLFSTDCDDGSRRRSVVDESPEE